jgi:hypothetical protein
LRCNPCALNSKSAFVVNPHFDESAEPPEVGVDFHQVEDGALIDGRFNRQRQAKPAQVTGRTQGMGVGFRRDRSLLLADSRLVDSALADSDHQFYGPGKPGNVL